MFVIGLVIFLVGLNFFWPSFSLAFGGDEYLALLDLKRALMSAGSEWFSWKFFFSNYGPTDLIFGAIYKFFGYSQAAVFVFSFLFRLIAAYSLAVLVYTISKSKLASSVSGMYFMAMLAGLETTSWSFNLSSYLALACYCWFLVSWLTFKKKPGVKLFLIYGMLFWVSIVLQPIRMGGLAILGFLIEGYWLVTNFSPKNLVASALGIIWLFGLFLSFFAIGESFGRGNNFYERITSAWSNQSVDGGGGVIGALKTRDQKVFYNYVAQFGAIVNPHNKIDSRPAPGINQNLIIFTVVLAILACIAEKKASRLLMTFLVFGLVWALEVSRVSKLEWFPVPSGLYLTWLASGGYVVLLLMFCYLLFSKNKWLRIGVLIGSLWMMLTIVFFWMRFPREVQMTYHRYLVSPGMGLGLILGMIVSSASLVRQKVIVGVIIVLLISQNALRVGQYFETLNVTRGFRKTESIRKSLPKIVYSYDKPIVYYFEADRREQEILRDAIMFGFPAIVAIRDDLDYFPRLVYVASWEELSSIAATGDGLERFSWPIKPVMLSDVYTFRLEGDKLVETTVESRNKLKR